jgi:hypothetical protein
MGSFSRTYVMAGKLSSAKMGFSNVSNLSRRIGLICGLMALSGKWWRMPRRGRLSPDGGGVTCLGGRAGNVAAAGLGRSSSLRPGPAAAFLAIGDGAQR